MAGDGCSVRVARDSEYCVTHKAINLVVFAKVILPETLYLQICIILNKKVIYDEFYITIMERCAYLLNTSGQNAHSKNVYMRERVRMRRQQDAMAPNLSISSGFSTDLQVPFWYNSLNDIYPLSYVYCTPCLYKLQRDYKLYVTIKYILFIKA